MLRGLHDTFLPNLHPDKIPSFLPPLLLAVLVIVSLSKWKHLNLLQLIILPFLLLYFLLTNVAQQYYIWVLPFLFFGSFRAALTYSLAGGIAVAVAYWKVYPQILFGSLPVVHFPDQYVLWLHTLPTGIFWITIGWLIVEVWFSKTAIETRAVDSTSTLPNPHGESAAILKDGHPSRPSQLAGTFIYGVIVSVTLAESIFLFGLDTHHPWKILKAIGMPSSAHKREYTYFQIPKAALWNKGFLWYEPDLRKLHILDAEGKPPKEFVFYHPDTHESLDVTDMAVDSENRIIVSDWRKGFLGAFDFEGRLVRHFGGGLRAPTRFALGPDDSVVVIDIGRQAVLLFSKSAEIIRQFDHSFGEGAIPIESFDVGLDKEENIYILDGVSQRIYVIRSNARSNKSFSVNAFTRDTRLYVDPKGYLWLLSLDSAQIPIYSPDGDKIDKLANPPGLLNQPLDTPSDILFGADGQIYVADAWRSKIYAIDFAYRRPSDPRPAE
ncbi:MAG: hypothetical protein Q7W02_26000 [Candidatus Rokubacteria bacterium]|nr:hypothetical protein [Candidatus Rokubacteria bacterium]